MIFAQIKGGLIKNTIVITDVTLLPFFQCDPITGVPFDYVLQIDQLYPRPGIDWTFDGIAFLLPDDDGTAPGFVEVTATASTSTNNSAYQLLNGMSYSSLPGANYLIQFTGTFSTNVPLLSTPGVLISVFLNGVQQVASEMSQNNTTANSPFNMSTAIQISTSDNDLIEIRWKNNGAGNTISCTTRVLDIEKVG